MKKNKVFLGYAVFYKGEHFPSSGNTVTRDKLYLKAHALGKLGRVPKASIQERRVWQRFINGQWRLDRNLTLRRVYAE